MEEGRKVTVNFGGIGTILAIVFMILRLTGNIDWPWIWIFAPIWIPLALVLLIYIVMGIALLIEIIRG